MPRKKKVKPRRRELCKFIITGDVNFEDFACTKCGKPIKWKGVRGKCCGIKYGVKRK